MEPRFIPMKSLRAAVDFLGSGAIEINRYESEIMDLVRRRGAAGQRFPARLANGHPHRYFEQTAIGYGAFVDPRVPTATPTVPTREERAAALKACTNEIDFGLFDVELTQQQGQFPGLVAKDQMDMLAGILNTLDRAIWNGTGTDLTNLSELQYVGLLTQINRTAQADTTASPADSIVDVLKTETARLMAVNQIVSAVTTYFSVMPSAIYCDPLVIDLIEREEKAFHRTLPEVQLFAGVSVAGLRTQAGILPLIPEPFMPYTGTAPSITRHAVIVSENLIERAYLTSPIPRMFQLGTVAGLAAKYVGVMFDNLIAKGVDHNGDTYAHVNVSIISAT